MPCYSPMRGFRGKLNSNGKRPLVFRPQEIAPGYEAFPVNFPCGQCIGCRLERSRQWAVRCVHEASLYDRNCFITLTYSPENLPQGGTLVLKHFQDFFKRLRKRFGSGIRFFHCGEYGEKYSRPHYHACIFNFDFPDRLLWKTVNDVKYYTSDILDDLWGHGFCTVGDVSFQSAAYVARYITKKQTGARAKIVYENIDYSSGEIFQRRPEYVTMSRRPGIGKGWFERFSSDVFPSDEIAIISPNGLAFCKPPKYYDYLFELADPVASGYVRTSRRYKGYALKDSNSEDRLRVKEICKLLTFDLLTRGYENE